MGILLMKQRLLPVIATGVFFLIVGLSLGELLAIELNLTTAESLRSNSALGVLAAIFGATGMFQYRQRDQATRAKREIECRIGRVFVSATWALDFLYSTPENAFSATRKRMHGILQMFEETRTAMAGLSASNPQLIAAHRHLNGISTSALVALVDKRVPDCKASARDAIQALQSDIVAAKKLLEV
jgi:hypothetical protein